MKYPVELCPHCGCGDAEEDAKGIGLIIRFHPQTTYRQNLPGTILFVGCNHCQYIGPIVLSPNGFSERRAVNAWNEHIKPGSTIKKSDLVKELSKREDVRVFNASTPHYEYEIHVKFCPEEETPGVNSYGEGPAIILVVKE